MGTRARGEANKALAAYQAHDRLHTTENREQAIEKMLADWNEQRMNTAQGKTVMLTDASNKELDRINEQAQALRAEAGDLGAARASIPNGPYTLAPGDQIIFTKPMWIPGQDRVENGMLGAVKDIHTENELTVTTSGAKERDVKIDTREYQDIRLAYAQHVYKAQGLTADRAPAVAQAIEPKPETALALTPGPSIESGVGAVAPQDAPDPVPWKTEQDLKADRDRDTDRSPDPPAITPAEDPDRDLSSGIE
jgi:hypothetical protein